jgi:hypothetical protein
MLVIWSNAQTVILSRTVSLTVSLIGFIIVWQNIVYSQNTALSKIFERMHVKSRNLDRASMVTYP